MTWTDPTSLGVGKLVTDDDLNAKVRGNLLHLYEVPVCVVRRTTTLSAAQGETVIPYDSEIDDPDGMHGANQPEVVTNRFGIWHTSGQVQFPASAAGYRYGRIFGFLRQIGDAESGSDAWFLRPSGFDIMASSTQITMYAGHNAGGSLTLSAGMMLEVYWMGAGE